MGPIISKINNIYEKNQFKQIIKQILYLKIIYWLSFIVRKKWYIYCILIQHSLTLNLIKL